MKGRRDDNEVTLVKGADQNYEKYLSNICYKFCQTASIVITDHQVPWYKSREMHNESIYHE